MLSEAVISCRGGGQVGQMYYVVCAVGRKGQSLLINELANFCQPLVTSRINTMIWGRAAIVCCAASAVRCRPAFVAAQGDFL